MQVYFVLYKDVGLYIFNIILRYGKVWNEQVNEIYDDFSAGIGIC